MKYLTCFFIFTLLFIININAQERDERHRDSREKLEQLEKLKLIDALQMNEETTLKFFARKSEHDRKLDRLREDQKNIVDEMEDLIKNSKNDNSSYKNLINEFLENNKKIESEKQNFILSLSDILSEKQILQLITFQSQWKDNIRKLLMKMRYRKHN